MTDLQHHHKDCKLHNMPPDTPETECDCGAVVVEQIAKLLKKLGEIRFMQGVKAERERIKEVLAERKVNRGGD